MDRLLEKYWGHVWGDHELSLQIRLYRLFCLVTGTTCLLVIMPVNLLQNLPWVVNAANLLLGLTGLALYRASLRGRDFLFPFYFVLILLLDLVWFPNAGSSGSIPYFFFPVLLYPMTVFRDRIRWVMGALLIVNVCALLVFEHYFPSLLVPFKSSSDRVLDLTTGIFCSFLAMGLVVWVILTNYDAEREIIAQYARELGTSEKNYREVVENARSIILRVGRRGEVTFFNRFSEDLFGFRREEILGQPVAGSIMPGLGQPGESVDTLLERLLALTEDVSVCRNGRRIRIHWNCQPIFNEQGGTAEILCVGTDVTERAALLERLQLTQQTMDAAAEQIIWSEAGGRIIYANTAARETLGYSAAEIHRLTVQNISDDLTATAWEMYWSVMKRNRSVTVETVEKRKDGTRIPVEIAMTYLNIGGKEYATAFVRDITERKQAEEQRRQVEQQMQHMQRLEGLGLLAGGLAHDYNNLLVGILGNISLAKMDLPPQAEGGKFLAEAEKASLRAKDLTAKLLAFSSGGKPARNPMALEPVLRESVGLTLQGAAVEWDLHLPPDLWPVSGDPVQLTHVFGNLVSYAGQTMPDGGRITLTADNLVNRRGSGALLKADRYVRVTVRDNGAGIPEEHLSRVFDPYYATEQTGGDLGLAVAYSIIKNHEGRISVQSKVGEGTTFTILLPAVEAAAASVSPSAIRAGAAILSVLIMDDEEMVRKPLGRMLEKMGHKVTATRDGAEALAAYRQAMARGETIDLVIMDLTVPNGMGGKEAIQRLRAIDPQVKAIVSSGYSADPVMADHQAHGFHGVMAKPYTLEQLQAMLKDCQRTLA